MAIKVVLVDDHQLFREGLRSILEAQPDFRVVGEAGDARAAYVLVDAARPDVVLLDLLLPGVDGISATREILRRAPETRVLILSAVVEEARVAEALAVGALGYAVKGQTARELLQALREVHLGRTYVSPMLRPTMVAAFARAHDAASDGPLSPLTRREREIFLLLVGGSSNSAVAAELCISVKTVETHRSNVLRKLGLHSLNELIRFAARHKLLRD